LGLLGGGMSESEQVDAGREGAQVHRFSCGKGSLLVQEVTLEVEDLQVVEFRAADVDFFPKGIRVDVKGGGEGAPRMEEQGFHHLVKPLAGAALGALGELDDGLTDGIGGGALGRWTGGATGPSDDLKGNAALLGQEELAPEA